MEAHIFVRAEFEISPLLIDLLLLAVYDLLNLLDLIVCLQELAGTDGLRIAVLLRAVLDDIKDGRDVIGRSLYESIDCLWMATRNGFTINFLAAWNLETVWTACKMLLASS